MDRIAGRTPRDKIVLWTSADSVFAHQGAYLWSVCLGTKHILICKVFPNDPKYRIYMEKPNAYCHSLVTLNGQGHC